MALEAVLRRDKLDAGPRVHIFATLAEHFRSLVTFPETATLGLIDEQYVRDVVDLLFRQSVKGVALVGRESRAYEERRVGTPRPCVVKLAARMVGLTVYSGQLVPCPGL